MRIAERISSIVMLGVCGLFFALSSDFSKFGALFPRVVIGILAALSLTLFILTFVQKRDDELIKATTSLKSLYSLAIMVAWAFVIDVLGFAVTSVIFFSIITVMLDKKARSGIGLVKRLGLVVGLVGIFYVFFALFLFVPFPQGILF